MEYVVKSREEHKAQLDSITAKLNKVQKENGDLRAINAELNEKLSVYRQKEDEIDKLSKSIAKMHIIASTNAKTVMDKATESFSAAGKQIEANINCAEATADSLNSIRNEFSDCYIEFCEKIDALSKSLECLKNDVDANTRVGNEKISSFLETFNKVDNR